MARPCLILHQVTYTIPNTLVDFQNLSLSFEKQRTAIIGHNGLGKSTLLKLLTGAIEPHKGSVQREASLYYLPQDPATWPESTTVAQAMGIGQQWQAWQHIKAGNAELIDYDILGERWHLEQQAQQCLSKMGLPYVEPSSFMASLSGGEKTRVLLAGSMLSGCDFILLDEPTNNLDRSAKASLLTWLKETQQNVILISHDRKLLNQVDTIIELSTTGVHCYGGHYDLYVQQKSAELEAAKQQYLDAKKTLKKEKRQAQKNRECLERRQSKGRQERRTGSHPKMVYNAKQAQNEKTQARMAQQNKAIIREAENKLKQTQQQLENHQQLILNLNHTRVPTGKTLLQAHQLTFHYECQQPLLQNFDLTVQGPERIAIIGDNGSGKTTLLNLLMGRLIPTAGEIEVGAQNVCYLDQTASVPSPEASLLNNLLKLNPETALTDAYLTLAHFLFKNTSVHKPYNQLSGGEKIRAGLACHIMRPNPPQLLVLDEPTNHLDLTSIECIESALNQYQGGLIVSSHDEYFMNNINVHRTIDLS